ncbi:TPA: threonine dehydratase [Candidatus Bathyarchaeota archaeon]|nr:threonine dehydratase [Candidatus Bathyarchaeota archaeon]
MYTPTLLDVLAARKRIQSYLAKTPLREYSALSEAVGCEVFVKHENHQPTCAFKIRGGINLVSQLGADERLKGVVTASTGNHGQSIALACRMFGVKATVCVPRNPNPDKVRAIRSYGAEIVEEGVDFEEAKNNAEGLARERGARYVHSGNEPHLIAGVGTIGLEMVEDQPDLDVVIVPIGGGSGASGVSTVYKAMSPGTRVIGVQAEEAQSVYLSWRSGRMESTGKSKTFADGLATRSAFELPLEIMRKNLDGFVLVSEEEMRAAIRLYVGKAHTIAEGAGAASLAAAVKMRGELRGKRVGVVLSGGNLTVEMLRDILANP